VLCPTHDIDYLRKWRPGILYREVVPYFFRNHLGQPIGHRLRRLLGVGRDIVSQPDPQRTAFERMHAEVARRGGTATYFLKMGAHGPRDVHYDPQDRYLAERVAALDADGFEVGLHPSYHAHTHPEYLAEERDRLAAVTGGPPRAVRQHYLRYEPTVTPRLQAAAGFRIDSTLGFAEHEGFRRGTCLPFRLFDVTSNAPLDLWELPLAVMESALFNRRHLERGAARMATRRVLQTCERFGGVAVMLWHNVLWDERDHPGWGDHFMDTLDGALDAGAAIYSLRDAIGHWDPRILGGTGSFT
jgi:peptidoglycan/xylan/chitin deacetylase (PgdA/CDA1 family)